MSDSFQIIPGKSLEFIAEEVYQYTMARPRGKVVVDIKKFDALTVYEIMQLFTELPKVENFVNPKYEGLFEIKNATWAIKTAIGAVFHTIIYNSAQNTQFVS